MKNIPLGAMPRLKVENRTKTAKITAGTGKKNKWNDVGCGKDIGEVP